MKIKQLILQGFKSFKDRTVITFDKGITGIVGPNGCGKSNVVDALFWVMGEQSAKHLRGDNMKDVIFSGSQKYAPASFAEVSLVLENEEGKHFHIGQTVANHREIKITRKLYRNSETEYRINDMPCRLKDIQEVFMDTGAGAKSYSIIAQGEIARLVQAKPEERRTMIEEVAGITKFKVRRRESMRKIEQTNENLVRLCDLKNEIEKSLKNLENQAEKAEKAKRLREKIENTELIVTAHKEWDLLLDYKEAKTTIDELKTEVETQTAKKLTLENDLQEERIRRDELTEQVDALQKEYNEMSKEQAKNEGQERYFKSSINDKEKQVNQREKERAELERTIGQRLEKVAGLENEKAELEEKGQETIDFSELEERVSTMKDELEFKESAVDDLKREIAKDEEEFKKADQENFRNQSLMQDLAAQLEDLTKEIEVLEKQYSGVSGQMAGEREEIQTLEKETGDLEVSEKNLQLEVRSLEEEHRNSQKEYLAKEKEWFQSQSRLDGLKQISASLEGVKEGCGAFLKNENDSKGFSLLGTLIRCDEKYTGAVQNLLEEFMDTLVNLDGSLDSFKSWYAGNKEKGIELLECEGGSFAESPETLERFALNGLEGLVPLNEVLSFQDDKAEKLRSFFKGYYLVENFDENLYSKVSQNMKFKAMASYDGKVLVRNVGEGKILSLKGSKDSTQGAVERNNQIVKLTEVCERLEGEVAALESQTESFKERLESKRTEYEEVRNKHQDIRSKYLTKKASLDAKVKGFEGGLQRLDIQKNRKSDVSRRRLELIERDEVLAKRVDEMKGELEDKKGRFEEEYSEYEMQKESYDDLRRELMQKQMEARSMGDKMKAINNRISDFTFQLEKEKERLNSVMGVIEQNKNDINEMDVAAGELRKRIEELVGTLREKERILKETRNELQKLVNGMGQRETEVRNLGKRITDAERKAMELSNKRERYLEEEEVNVRNVFEQYRVDLRLVIGNHLQFTEDDFRELRDVSNMYIMETENGPTTLERRPYEFHVRYDIPECKDRLRRYKSEINQLGDINWQAIEDYQRQKVRFDFLKEQETELRTSLEDLQKAIQQIDEKCRERFKMAFEEVVVRFQKVFPIIFNGGSAKLVLTGDANDPECGVDIVAQPPGKKMQNINLMSGGEKAMTAVSLIFSIFLVKPSPFCLLDEVDAPLDDANVGRFNELLRELCKDSQFILITHNKKTMEMNDILYGVTMQEPGVSTAVSMQLQ